MYFEINVSLNGRHYLVVITAECSLHSPEEEARKVYDDFKSRFPETEGFKITVTKWETAGTSLKWG